MNGRSTLRPASALSIDGLREQECHCIDLRALVLCGPYASHMLCPKCSAMRAVRGGVALLPALLLLLLLLLLLPLLCFRPRVSAPAPAPPSLSARICYTLRRHFHLRRYHPSPSPRPRPHHPREAD